MKNSKATFTTFNFYRESNLDKGRVKHQESHDIGALGGIMAEAISYGYDIQFIQPKDKSNPSYCATLYFSTKGFKQR